MAMLNNKQETICIEFENEKNIIEKRITRVGEMEFYSAALLLNPQEREKKRAKSKQNTNV